LDIGKKDLKACVRSPSPSGKRSRRQEIRTFATTTNALLELRDWLVAEKVTLVVLEATGDYWTGCVLPREVAVALPDARFQPVGVWVPNWSSTSCGLGVFVY
jgi:hypothetical protein